MTRSDSNKTSDEFEPLQRPRALNDMAYENIKRGILTGKLASGQIYSELELAKKFGVSRTPVREALLKLSAESLIVFHPRKGISVTFFSEEDIENLFELRQTLEETAVSKIIGTLTKSQIQVIDDLIAQQERCIKRYDENLFLDFDRKFHLFIVEATHNRFMVQTYENIRNYITIPARAALMKKGRPSEVLREHKAIVKALSEGDVQGTKNAVETHLVNSKLAALESCREVVEE